MSSDSSATEEPQTEVLFQTEIDESSEDPPMSEWSSLVLEIPEENKKKLGYEAGTYDPGSGELCTKYIAMSASSVLRHPYYNYPCVKDPGITDALLHPEEKIIYPDDGQELYLAVCKEMSHCPVGIFYRSLLDDAINLEYYCVNPFNVRAMAMALRFNRMVKTLNLTDNFLNNDACFHLSEMLVTNSCLQEINMNGCKIGPEGVRRLLKGLCLNRTLISLNLSVNALGDEGIQYIADAIFKGLDVKKIYLKRNNIGSKGANALAEAFETHNKFSVIDLSWNNFYSPEETYNLLTRLGEADFLQDVDLSWCSLSGDRIGLGLRKLLLAPNLRNLILHHNKLSGAAIESIIKNLQKPKNLFTFDLSYNPISEADALNVINKVKTPEVMIQKLLLENVTVDEDFIKTLEEMKTLESKKNDVVTYGSLKLPFKPVGIDSREILLKRADYLAKKPKKNKVDIALVAMQLLKDKNEIMLSKEFSVAVRALGTALDDDLLEAIVNVFAGPKTGKSTTIDVRLLVDYIHRLWPDRTLPPTPPPESGPIQPQVKKNKGEKKGKKK